MKDKVAFITGASRGIGRAIALKLAAEGVHCVIAAKTVEPNPALPGTVHSVAEECRALGAEALALKVNVRHPEEVEQAVEATVERFGRLDIAIHNAGALWWKPIADTPVGKFDLVMDVNARGAYALAYAARPHLIESRGHFIVMSPPVDESATKDKTAYMLSKFGMTMIARGLAAEHPEIAANALWPETLIESAATRNFGLGGPSMWYKADIVADAVWELVRQPEPSRPSGQALLVMSVLRSAGVTDFRPYRCDPGSEPPILTASEVPRAGGDERADGKPR